MGKDDNGSAKLTEQEQSRSPPALGPEEIGAWIKA
jgi:hypothetical protein